MASPQLNAEQRAALVEAAERAARRWAGQERNFGKAQLSQLASVAREAWCAEEVENYVRYQAGRRVWSLPMAQEVIQVLVDLEKNSKVRLQMWRHFATYFRRAWTYNLEAGGGR